MDTALLSVPLDSEEYERKAEFLSILHQYVEGTYTIFPEKKQAVEIAVPEQGQISMFDFMEQEPQSKEQSTVAAVEEPQKDAPLADEKPSEQMLQPMPLDEANEYNALKERYPDALAAMSSTETLSSTAKMQGAFRHFWEQKFGKRNCTWQSRCIWFPA